MTLVRSVAFGLLGATTLAAGRVRGILWMEFDARAVARSFWAIPLALPAALYLAVLDRAPGAIAVDPFVAVVRHAAVFLVAWLAFAVFTHRVAPLLHRAQFWAPTIVAWNWCSVPENMLLVLGTLPGTFGAPPIVDQAAQIATFVWAIGIEWFVFRLTFGAGPLLAIWLVLVDQSIGLLVTVLDRLLTAG